MNQSHNQGFVLIHPILGLYVGRGLNKSYWSKLDAAGRDSVATFADPAQARWHVELWEGGWPEDEAKNLRVQAVQIDRDGGWASVAALRDAGLEDHLGELAHPGWMLQGGRC
jgi:hypothetical protein